jgi:hypothetical protein
MELPPPEQQAVAEKQPHIVFGMNTIARNGGEDYLSRTLDSLRTQFVEAESQTTAPPQTSVVVLDPRGNPGNNRPWQQNQQALSADPHFHFESKHSVQDPFEGHQEPKDPNSSDVPGAVGRQVCAATTPIASSRAHVCSLPLGGDPDHWRGRSTHATS